MILFKGIDKYEFVQTRVVDIDFNTQQYCID